MSLEYGHLTHTNFPNSLDMFFDISDPTNEDWIIINQYSALIRNGQTAAALELLAANPSVLKTQLNADKILKLMHAIQAVECYYFDSVKNQILRLGNLKGDWNNQMSTSATGDNKLNMFDVVKYPVDGVYQYFMVDSNDIPAGTLPTNSEVYLQLSIRGDKGDTGEDGIDGTNGIDGASGLGLSPRGAWINNKEYYQYDLVSHDGVLWYALENNVANEPLPSSAIWVNIDIALQVSYGTDEPIRLSNGGVWLHLQDDGRVIMKTKQQNGDFISINPETKAQYITSTNGENLQNIIYKDTMNRDDVTVDSSESGNVMTSIARLKSNSNVIVGRSVTTDTLDVDNKMTTDFTVYDNTGIYVVYKATYTTTENTDGSLHGEPLVIIG